MSINTHEDVSIEVKKAAQLSIIEVGLGSIGHGFKIPLFGHVLSINQLTFLLNAINSLQLPKSATFEISGIAAILKSLSPAGKKIGPMLSISAQGFLFWFGITILGNNIVGQIVGSILLSLWAFFQPLITLFMIYGFDLEKLIYFYKDRISNDYEFLASSIIYGILAVSILKCVVAISLVLYSNFTRKEVLLFKNEKMSQFTFQNIKSKKNDSSFRSAVKDLFKPLFLVSFILMIIFVWQIDGTITEKIWMSLRPLAIAFILFYLLRSPWFHNNLFKISQKSKLLRRLHLKATQAAKLMFNKKE